MSTLNKVLVRILALVALPAASLTFAIVLAESLGVVSLDVSGSRDDPPPSPEARAGAAAPDETVHAVGAAGVLIIIASGLILLAVRPERAGSAYQVLGASAGMLAAIALVGNPNNYGGQAGPLDPAFLVLALPGILAGLAARPWRGESDEGASRRLLLVLMVVGSIPAAYYGIEQGLIQRNTFPPVADPHHQAHWYAMSVAGFSTILVLAAASSAKRGWRFCAASGGLTAILVGAGSIVSPASASSLNLPWAAAALLWGAFVLVVTWRGSMRLNGDRVMHQRPPTVSAGTSHGDDRAREPSA